MNCFMKGGGDAFVKHTPTVTGVSGSILYTCMLNQCDKNIGMPYTHKQLWIPKTYTMFIGLQNVGTNLKAH